MGEGQRVGGLCHLRRRLVLRWAVVGCGDGIGIGWMVVWVAEEAMVIVGLDHGEEFCRSRVAFCSLHFGMVVLNLGENWVVWD